MAEAPEIPKIFRLALEELTLGRKAKISWEQAGRLELLILVLPDVPLYV
jgi:hypothetical protein